MRLLDHVILTQALTRFKQASEVGEGSSSHYVINNLELGKRLVQVNGHIRTVYPALPTGSALSPLVESDNNDSPVTLLN